jgi:hypothetical protein
MIVSIRFALMFLLNTSTLWNGAGLIELLMIYVFYTANLFVRITRCVLNILERDSCVLCNYLRTTNPVVVSQTNSMSTWFNS